MHVYQYLWDCIKKRNSVKTTICQDADGSLFRIAWTKDSCFPPAPKTYSYIAALKKDERNIEMLAPSPRLIILGAGHIGQILCEIAHLAGFGVVVYDDRSEFVTRERFSHADGLICDKFQAIREHLTEGTSDYYVILTHGHVCDEECARIVLLREYTYLGMIGSKAKVAAVREHLQKDGYPKEKVDSMYAPIGLKIGGNTPGEIAVSIVAQLVFIKNQEHRMEFNSDIGDWIAGESHTGIMVTISQQEGSVPGKQGSRMFVRPNQSTIGTIGGGALELTAIKEAMTITRITKKHYELSENPGGVGMACQGSVEVLFEPVG